VRTTMKASIWSAGVFSAALLLTQSASAFIIDSFDTQASLYELVSVSVTAPNHLGISYTPSGAGSGTVLGSERDISVYKTAGAVAKSVEAAVNPGDGYMRYFEDSSAKGELWLTWDGADNAPDKLSVATGGLGSQNFLADGANKLTVSVQSLGIGVHSLSLKLWSTSGTQSAIVTHSFAGSGAYDPIAFSYADFLVNNSSLNLGAISAVQMRWYGGANGTGNANFDWIGTDVPEPGTMSLMAVLMGLGGLGVVIRRRLTGVK